MPFRSFVHSTEWAERRQKRTTSRVRLDTDVFGYTRFKAILVLFSALWSDIWLALPLHAVRFAG